MANPPHRPPPQDFRELVRRENRRQIELARRSMVPKTRKISVTEQSQRKIISVTRSGVGPIVTPHGEFALYSFDVRDRWRKYAVLIGGEIDENFQPSFSSVDRILLRVDSGCETGQLFQDQTCECKEQLWEAMRMITAEGEGLIINIPTQDGRGMGLPFKLATLRLQAELEHTTVEAASLLEPNSSRDVRTYAGVIAILKFLEIEPGVVIRLMTNNPKKTGIFGENGYSLEYVSIVIPPTPHTQLHLQAKRDFLNHRLPPEGE